jgi:hypothetical protein
MPSVVASGKGVIFFLPGQGFAVPVLGKKCPVCCRLRDFPLQDDLNLGQRCKTFFIPSSLTRRQNKITVHVPD